MPGIGTRRLLGGAIVALLALVLAIGPGALPLGSTTPSADGLARAEVTPSSGFTLSEDGLDPVAVGLNWTQSTDLVFDHYEVDESTRSSNGGWTAIDNITTATSTSTTVTPLAPGTNYWFRVIDYTVLSGTTTSNTLAVTTPNVTQLSYSGLTASSVKLSWTNSASYAGTISFHEYAVEEATGGGAYSAVATVTSAASLSYTVNGLASSTGYSFEVNTTDTCCGGTSLGTTSNTVTVGTATALTASALAHPTGVDVGQSVGFDCSVAGGVAPYTYVWAFGDGAQGSGASPTHAYGRNGTYQATCTVTDASSVHTSAIALVSVSPSPAVAVSADRTDASPGSALTFNASPSGGSGSYSGVDWRFGDGTSASGTNVMHAWAKAGVYRVIAAVHDSNGGSASGSVVITVASVTANASVNATSGDPSSIFQFLAVGGGGAGPAYTYAWSFGDGANGSGAVVDHAFHGAGSYTASVHVTDALGASATASAPTVRVYFALSATIQLSTPSPTTGEPVTLNAHVSGGSGSYACTWTIPGSSPLTGCTTIHTWDSSGRYPIVLIVRDPSAGNASTTVAVVVTGNPVTPPPTSPSAPGGTSHLWVLSLLAIPVLVVIWQLSRRSSSTRPIRSSSTTPPPPDARGGNVPLATGPASVAPRTANIAYATSPWVPPPPLPRVRPPAPTSVPPRPTPPTPSPPSAPIVPSAPPTVVARPCANCGAPVPRGAEFCPQCERRISDR